MLVTSNFSFSHHVFHSYISVVCQNVALCGNGLNSVLGDKVSAMSKLKAFADDDFFVAQMVLFFFDMAENIFGKGGRTCY